MGSGMSESRSGILAAFERPCQLEAATVCSMIHTCHCSQVNTHKILRLEEQRNRLCKAMIWFGMHETAVCSAGVARKQRHPRNDQGLHAVKVNTKGGISNPTTIKGHQYSSQINSLQSTDHIRDQTAIKFHHHDLQTNSPNCQDEGRRRCFRVPLRAWLRQRRLRAPLSQDLAPRLAGEEGLGVRRVWRGKRFLPPPRWLKPRGETG